MSSSTDAEWHKDVNDFWFKELSRDDWFRKNEAVDQEITTRFAALYDMLAADPSSQPIGNGAQALALVIVLDQFPRNMFRGTAKSFATDEASLAISQHAVAQGMDEPLGLNQRQFLYMPFMHAEDAASQARCVELFTALGNEGILKFAVSHKQIVDRFGRFPHRNAILGRESTQEERAFLEQPNSSF